MPYQFARLIDQLVEMLDRCKGHADTAMPLLGKWVFDEANAVALLLGSDEQKRLLEQVIAFFGGGLSPNVVQGFLRDQGYITLP